MLAEELRKAWARLRNYLFIRKKKKDTIAVHFFVWHSLNNITVTGDTAGATLPTQMQSSTMSVDSPGTASGDDLENSNGDWTTSQPPTQPNPAVANVNEMFKVRASFTDGSSHERPLLEK